jgi:cytoskeleton protein RodZ
MDPIQNPLFREPIGSVFRAKREQLGMSLDDAAKQLKFGAHFLQAIEHEEWDKLGAPIFAKSYINSYAKLLGLNEAIRDEIPSMPASPGLKAITATKIEPAGGGAKWVLAVVSIAGLAAAVYFFNNRQEPEQTLSLDNLISVPAQKPPVQAPAASTTQSTSIAIPGNEPANAVPVVEAAPAAIAATAEFRVKAAQENWLEVRGKDNAVLFSGMIKAGQDYSQTIDKIGRITLGNAGTAEVRIGGNVQDLSAIISDDVAKFSIAADGRPVPASQ